MEKIRVLDVPVHSISMEDAVQCVAKMLASPGIKSIMAINPEKIIAYQNNPQLKKAIDGCELLIPDGIGAVVGARLFGDRRIRRVAGADLMPNICALAAEMGSAVYIFGAAPGVAADAAATLKARYPRLRIAGAATGYVPSGRDGDVIEEINTSGADILFVGIGSPAQEIWIDRHKLSLNVKLIQAVGGSIDVLAGRVARAPGFMRAIHLEWLHRLLRQPQRASRQRALPQFAYALLRAKINSWVRTTQ